MASTSGWSTQMKDVELSDTSRTMGGSNESEYLKNSASQVDHANTSAPFLSALNESIIETEKSGDCSNRTKSVEEQIEHSKSHCSILADHPGCNDDEEECEAEVSNVKEFKALQSNPTWGGFFQTFGYETETWKSSGEMEVGEKFAEGAQAELYHAHVTRRNPEYNERDLKYGHEYVVKVVKKGIFLKHLKPQLPLGLLQFLAKNYQKRIKSKSIQSAISKVLPRYSCSVQCGTLLKNGRFAFLMMKELVDLRKVIDRYMKSRIGEDCGPFPKEEVENIMYLVALGMNCLHDCDIVHRDLKTSNVLVREFKSCTPKWDCFVANYECSVGVVGTRFLGHLKYCKHTKSRK